MIRFSTHVIDRDTISVRHLGLEFATITREEYSPRKPRIVYVARGRRIGESMKYSDPTPAIVWSMRRYREEVFHEEVDWNA